MPDRLKLKLSKPDQPFSVILKLFDGFLRYGRRKNNSFILNNRHTVQNVNTRNYHPS